MSNLVVLKTTDMERTVEGPVPRVGDRLWDGREYVVKSVRWVVDDMFNRPDRLSAIVTLEAADDQAP